MVQESPILENDLIFLMQTKNKNLEALLTKSVNEDNVRLESVENSDDLKLQQFNNHVITFIVGSDVDDPIQSAQRFHTQNKKAKIVLLAKSEKQAETLREAVKFSPFIGDKVFCVDESSKERLEIKLNDILHDSVQAEKYRAIITESNAQIPKMGTAELPVINQQFINKLMDIAPIGIVIVDLEANVLGWNKEAASIFNKSEIQVLGTPLPQLFNPTEGNKLETFLGKNLVNNNTVPIAPLQLERETKDIATQMLNFTVTSFSFSEGNSKAFILAVNDETERKRAEEELQEINETLEERVKVRTASLMSYQNRLRSLASQLSKAEEDERQRLATELHDNLGQMLALSKMKISSLQQFEQFSDEAIAKIEDVKKVMDDALVYTRHLMSDLKPPPSLDKKDVRASIEWLAKNMKKHDLLVQIEDDGHPKPVSDEVRTMFVQSVRELLFNILKHSEVNEAGIQMTRTSNDVEIVVEDKGKGFDIETNNPSSYRGGFGLFNISERIDLLGGSFSIESEPGIGTKIKLCAPLTEEAQEVQEPEEKSSERRKTEKSDIVKVMLVDDHEMMRVGLRRIVNEEKDLSVVAEASDGGSAINLALKTSPNVVVMDVNMPVMNGIEATQKLLKKMPHVRVIALTFHDDQNVKDSMQNAGATAYLTKNEAFETLAATIRSEAKLGKK